jgi:hypothetical protein
MASGELAFIQIGKGSTHPCVNECTVDHRPPTPPTSKQPIAPIFIADKSRGFEPQSQSNLGAGVRQNG